MKRIYAVYVLAAIVALSACNKEDFSHEGGNGRALTIGKLKVNEVVTKADVGESSVVEYESDCCGSTFTISEVVTPIHTPETKAGIIDANGLKSTTFVLNGYLDAEIMDKPAVSADDMADQHFMKGATVAYGSDNMWHTENPYYWRNMINHYFWAYCGNGVSNFVVTDGKSGSQYGKATFDYTNAGGEDLLVTTSPKVKKWEEGQSGVLSGITFDHALAAFIVNESGIRILRRQNDGSTSENNSGGTLVDIKIVSYKEGKCTVENGFNWTYTNGTTDNTRGDRESVSLKQAGPNFVIPQDKTKANMILTIRDDIRSLTRDYEMNLNSWSGNWVAGMKYQYNLSGNVIMPYVSPGQSGLDLSFTGNSTQYKVILDDLNYNLVKKIRISWDGIPTANGAGTVTAISLEPLPVPDPIIY